MDSVIIFCAKYLFLAVVLTLGYVWLRASKAKKIETIVATLTAGIIAYVVMKLSSWLYYDPRPFVTQHIEPLVSHGVDNGFPSEHTVFSVMISTIIYLYNKRIGLIAFVIALVVGAGRVAAHVHSPIDIVGGVLIGVAAGVVGYGLATIILRAKKSS